MTCKFLVIGDLHLEKLETVLAGMDHIGLQLQALQHISGYAVENSLKDVVLLGDIFEQPYPKQKTLRRLLEVFCEWPRLNYHLIRGNHDVSSSYDNSLELLDFIAELRALENVNLYLSPVTTELQGIPVCFLPYPYKKPQKKQEQIVFAHHGVEGALADNGQLILKGDDTLKIRRKTANYWILGHIHLYQKGSRYLFPGTPYQMTFGESLPKGFCVIEAKKQGRLQVSSQFIQYDPPFRLLNLPLKTEKDLKKIKDNRLWRYKVIVTAKDVKFPLGWRNEYPNVVKVVQAIGKKNLRQEMQELKNLEPIGETLDTLDLTRNLSGFLKARGFDRKSRRRGKEIVTQILQEK